MKQAGVYLRKLLASSLSQPCLVLPLQLPTFPGISFSDKVMVHHETYLIIIRFDNCILSFFLLSFLYEHDHSIKRSLHRPKAAQDIRVLFRIFVGVAEEASSSRREATGTITRRLKDVTLTPPARVTTPARLAQRA